MTQNPGNPAAVARPWRPAPAIALSLLLHAAGVAALVLQPRLWPWVLGGLVANHLLLSASVLWPRGRILGPNLVRLPAAAAARNEVSLNFDDGPDPEVTPRVLDLLDRHQAKASFFCIGEKAAAHPDLVREIARRGHSVEFCDYRAYGVGDDLRYVDWNIYGRLDRLHARIDAARAALDAQLLRRAKV